MVHASYGAPYPKVPYVRHEVNIQCTCCMTSLLLESSMSLSQTSFSLYLHNQWTDFHKLSCAGKPQMRAIRTYAGCTKATTND